MATQRATVYLKPEILFTLGKMGEGKISGRVARVISRYGEIIKRVDVDALFTPGELEAIASIISEHEFMPASLLEPGVKNKIEDAPGKVFKNASRQTIIDKVKGLSFLELAALVERIRRITGSEE